MKLNIAILGTRGIPNQYGGFEQVAGHLAKGLVEKGHQVTVYNSHSHPYQQDSWNGVRIIHKYDPEKLLGTAGQFIYDLNCILDSRKRSFQVILMLGYTSSSLWGKLYHKKTKVVINMDGLEWKRSKYSKPVRRYLLLAENLAIRYADAYIADSPVIKNYLDTRYAIDCTYIPYGALTDQQSDDSILDALNLNSKDYFLLIARIEPENNIELILDGFHKSISERKFLVIGKLDTPLAGKLVSKYISDKRIIFFGCLYNPQQLHSLSSHCLLYFHGHSVGGTNPSLLEAMASQALIAAHNNPFNIAVLEEDGLYFSTIEEVKKIVEIPELLTTGKSWIRNNQLKIVEKFNWPAVVSQYENVFNSW